MKHIDETRRFMKKTRVAAYCRVSRGGAEPEHSLQAQAAYYKEMICAAPSFQFAGIYAEIASGLNIKRRPQFRKLLQDCKKGKVDLIFTKSVSRFARNRFPTYRLLMVPAFKSLYTVLLLTPPSIWPSCSTLTTSG